MMRTDSLAQLEATTGRDLQRALPPARLPADVSLRIRQRLETAASQAQPLSRKLGRRAVRWTVGAAVAGVVIVAGAFYESSTRTAAPDLTGPLFFGSSAFADTSEVPSTLPSHHPDIAFRLETALPILPEKAPVSLLSFATGTANPYWGYQDTAAERIQAQGQPPAGAAAAENVAASWLKQNGHYPSGPVHTSTHVGPDQVVTVRFEPGPGSAFLTVNEFPAATVWVSNSKVVTAMGIWPERTIGAGTVPLKTAEQAWADLQAGKYPWLGQSSDAVPFEMPRDPVVSVREVHLDQAMARAADGRWYLIPVVQFEGDISDDHGQVHSVSAFVPAVRPES